jgi:exosome complex exonuclease RRP6
MASPPDIPSLHSAVTSALIATTRSVSELCAEDLSFHRSLDPQISRSLDRQNVKLLDLAEKLINNAGADIASQSSGNRKSSVRNERSIRLEIGYSEDSEAQEAIESNWSKIVDVVDGLLEKADASLDEYTGVVKKGKMQGVAETEKANTAKVITNLEVLCGLDCGAD